MLNLGVDLKNPTQDTADIVSEALAEHLIVVIRNQHITPEEQLTFCKMIGEVESHWDNDWKRERMGSLSIADGVTRVTGAIGHDGRPGLFHKPETLEWHANSVTKPDRHSIVWIYANKGSMGSRTSWINMVKVYESLPAEIQTELETMKIHTKHVAEVNGGSEKSFFNDVVSETAFDVVRENSEGQKGLYYPFLQISHSPTHEDKFEELHEIIVEHALDPYHMYHHDWVDGDVVISDQWLTLHQREAFENIKEREMHRIALYYGDNNA